MARGFGIESLELKAVGLFGSALVQFGHCVENPVGFDGENNAIFFGKTKL